MSKPKPMTWDGIEYPSQAALAEVKGVSIGTVSYWYRRGYTSDDDLFKGTPTVLNGKWYKSRAAAARDNHMTRGGVYSQLAIQKRMEIHMNDKPLTLDDKLPKHWHDVFTARPCWWPDASMTIREALDARSGNWLWIAEYSRDRHKSVLTDYFVGRLTDEKWRVRRTAAYALGKIADARAVEPLTARLNDEHEHECVRQNAAEALGKIGDPRAVEPLIACLNDEDALVQRFAADALGDIGDARAVEPLAARLKDNEWPVRLHAACALGNIADARAVEPLIARLDDEGVWMREHAARALGDIGDTRAVEPLIACTGDEDEGVRSSAAWALGKIGDARAVEPLIACLNDEDARVRRSAKRALERIQGASQ